MGAWCLVVNGCGWLVWVCRVAGVFVWNIGVVVLLSASCCISFCCDLGCLLNLLVV